MVVDHHHHQVVGVEALDMEVLKACIGDKESAVCVTLGIAV